MRDKYKEINIINSKEVYNEQYSIYLRILVKIKSYKTNTIIDLSVIENFKVENTT